MFAATKSFFTNEATGGGALTPSWTIDFSTGSTYSDLVFARSANTATYVDSSGYVAGANADVLRLTHDKNGSRLGLLVEGSRTNSAQYSETFSNAYWEKFGSTIDNNAGSFWTSPANVLDAVLLEQTTASAAHRMRRDFTSQTNACFSIFAKKQNLTTGTGRAGRYLTLILGNQAASGNYYHATFDLDTGTVTQAANVGTTFSSVDRNIESYNNDWYRIWVTGTRASGTNRISIALADTGTPTVDINGQTYTGANDTDGVYVWGAQLEDVVGPPTSYIETPSNASVTRNNDTAYILDSSITGWADPGAIVVHFYAPGVAGTILSTDDTATEQLGIKANTTTTASAFWSSSETNTGTITTGVQKAVHYWSGTASSFCINGGTVETGTNNIGTFGNIDFVTLGAEATVSAGVPNVYSQFSNLIIRKVEFYAGTLTSGNLQTITT